MIQIYHLSALLYRWHIPVLPKLLYLLNRVLFSLVLPASVKVGHRVTFAYQGIGTVVHARAVIGDDVYIGPQVIIGGRSGEVAVPVIESGAFIGAGARVLGPVVIGRGAKVAAGALVLHDVPAGVTVAGIPAKTIHSSRAHPEAVLHGEARNAFR